MPEPSPALLQLLSDVLAGRQSVDELSEQVRAASSLPSAAGDESAGGDAMRRIEGATVDLGRQQRCGFGEVVYGQGKPAELIERIVAAQVEAGQDALVTRIDVSAARQLRAVFPNSHHNPVARTLRLNRVREATAIDFTAKDAARESGGGGERPHAAVVTAGSTDIPVAEEAAETLAWM